MIEIVTEYGLTFNRAYAPENGTVWRLVHDGERVLLLEATSGTTDSIHAIHDFESQEEANAFIAAENLSYTEPSMPEHHE